MLAESATVLFQYMFDKTEKETKTISLEEITLQDVDKCVGTHMLSVKQIVSSVSVLRV